MIKKLEEQALIYQLKNGALQLKVDGKGETLWANLAQIAELFAADKSGISRHINNIYKMGELHPIFRQEEVKTKRGFTGLYI